MTRWIGRRAFLCSLAASVASLGAFCLPHASDAQQSALPRHIGVILVGFSPESKEAQAFRQGLQEAGYVEGRDVVIEWRPANGDYARIPELAADRIQRRVDVIVVDSTVAARAVQRATSTISIVMVLVADPVGSGPATDPSARRRDNPVNLAVMCFPRFLEDCSGIAL